MAPAWSTHTRLPEFHGNKGESWELYELNIQLAYDGAGGAPADKDVKRAHLLGGLRGEAATFLELNPHLRRLSYDDALNALRKRFDQPSWKQIGELRYIRQEAGESARSYADRLRKAVRILDPGMEYAMTTKKEIKREDDGEEKEAVSEEELEKRKKFYAEPINKLIFMYFMTGLRENLQQAVRAALPRTLEDAIRVAEQHESYMELYHELGRLNLTMRGNEQNTTVNCNTTSSEYRNDKTVRQAQEQLRALNNNSPSDHMTGNRYQDERQKFNPNDNFRHNIRCYNCQKEGHYARECRSRRRENSYPANHLQRMDRYDSSMRRAVPILPRAAPKEQRSDDHPSSKFRKRVRIDSVERYRDREEKEKQSSRWRRERTAPPPNQRTKEEEKRPDKMHQPKNGRRPPQRGGSRPLPRPLRHP